MTKIADSAKPVGLVRIRLAISTIGKERDADWPQTAGGLVFFSPARKDDCGIAEVQNSLTASKISGLAFLAP